MNGYLGTIEHGAEKFEAEELEKKKKYCSEILGINCATCPDERNWCENHRKHAELMKEIGQIDL